MGMNEFVGPIAAELERQRPLTKQVSDHLASHYSISRDEQGDFLATELEPLEDYQIDLIFSPLFTPSLADQALFSSLLDHTVLPASDWPALVQLLGARPTISQIVTEDGRLHPVKLREVTIDRYVTRLNLDVSLPEPLLKLLNTLPPAEDRALLKALARRSVWKVVPRREVLFRYLLAATSNHFYQRDDLTALLKLMETYQPTGATDIINRIPVWQEVIRKEMLTAASPKPFFSERVQELHGGGRDQRHQSVPYIDSKKQELAFLDRLNGVLAG
jgi:hypothetical protein